MGKSVRLYLYSLVAANWVINIGIATVRLRLRSASSTQTQHTHVRARRRASCTRYSRESPKQNDDEHTTSRSLNREASNRPEEEKTARAATVFLISFGDILAFVLILFEFQWCIVYGIGRPRARARLAVTRSEEWSSSSSTPATERNKNSDGEKHTPTIITTAAAATRDRLNWIRKRTHVAGRITCTRSRNVAIHKEGKETTNTARRCGSNTKKIHFRFLRSFALLHMLAESRAAAARNMTWHNKQELLLITIITSRIMRRIVRPKLRIANIRLWLSYENIEL